MSSYLPFQSHGSKSGLIKESLTHIRRLSSLPGGKYLHRKEMLSAIKPALDGLELVGELGLIFDLDFEVFHCSTPISTGSLSK